MSAKQVEVIELTHKSASIHLTIWKKEHRVTLVALNSKNKNSGHGSELMEIVLKFLDTNKYSAILEAKPYHDDGLKIQELIKFYQKYGFSVTGGKKMEPVMERPALR